MPSSAMAVVEPNLECTHVTWWQQGKKELEGKHLCVPHPPETLYGFTTVLWVHFDLLFMAQACLLCLPASFLPVPRSCPQALECPVCPPVCSHMLFPLSRTPFYLFTWVSPPHLSRLSSATISSQQRFLLPGQGRASSGPSAPSPHSHVPQIWGVLAFVHAHPPHRPWAPPSSDSQLSMHYSPPFMLCPLMLPPNPSESFPTSPLPHFCVPSFLAESELEKEQWLEAMQRAIAEALSTWEVAERIWAVAPNRFCADCGAAQPDWASINLCVVICKRCAGV